MMIQDFKCAAFIEIGYDDNEAINDELKYGLDDWAESQIMV